MKSHTIIATMAISALCLAAPNHLRADNVSMYQQDPSKHHHYDNPAPEAGSYAYNDNSSYTVGTSAGATGMSSGQTTESMSSTSWSHQNPPPDRVGIRSKSVKSSDLIGKKVENQQGQKLGKIKDVVVAQQGGNETYAIIDKADRVKGTSHNVAVLTTDITSGPDRHYVVMNADKSRFDSIR
ncbi:PRC-barrel domain-containing protein [Pedosphaera parvula]|uniref:PRC-barrel domain-containing protein n=1 Tax=Pedosphaera parvula (strain Ellin514) TaxID=320771 RepID=B9XB53_PEDPL|nr:PRC-barrel domain-containing protein [Pedosphaera parvula]EEF62738.1 hypothetical protein Cflav_PD5373 [Pedosphaera parvula Ellin514]